METGLQTAHFGVGKGKRFISLIYKYLPTTSILPFGLQSLKDSLTIYQKNFIDTCCKLYNWLNEKQWIYSQLHFILQYPFPSSVPWIKFCSYLPSSSYAQKWKWKKGFPGGSDDKESAGNAGDLSSFPEAGWSPGEGKGYPTEVFLPGEFHGLSSLMVYSHEVARSQTQLKWLTRSHFFFSEHRLLDDGNLFLLMFF